ncbi:uncharacterized protein LOC132608077 [Lycium barbarum]|uniref:uncharacterized protein LOC132608077 n=1 Tax=Lycium barbarum TaxID=112863 RepID=UPI00293E1CE1|nr:uncharacterized protein LOC132608077 [Lycium barbarum]
MRDISRELHPSQKGELPSDTIPNSKNGGGGVDHVYAISTWSEEVPTEIPIVEKVADILKSSKKTETNDTSKQTVKGAIRPLTQIFKSTPPFPQRLVKKMEDAKCHRFYDRLKQLSMNIPFLDALTKKRSVKHDNVSVTRRVSAILSTTTVQKKEDLGAFTIPCFVGHHDFARALCDNGASINLIPLAIYKQPGLGRPSPTIMRLQMDDRSIKRPVGFVDDVLVWASDFLLPADFVILDCAVDRDIPIILGRLFLGL